MDGVYLLNSPFTFQSMEKHAAYCAMMRLGLKVPDTVLVPSKNPVDNARYAYTATRYNQPFDLDEIAEQDRLPDVHEALRRRRLGRRVAGAQRRGAAPGLRRVRRAADAPAGLGGGLRRVRPVAVHRRRDDGHAVPPRTADARPLRRAARVPLRRRPGAEVTTISKLVNAFFRWEFNSCELLVRGSEVHPIDYANACPDVALTSLHYYFPWAMSALVRWTVFCCATGRDARLDLDTTNYFAVADRTDLSYSEKLGRVPDGWPTPTSSPSATPTSAPPGCPMWTRSCTTGCARTSSTSCCWTRCAPPTRPHEHDRFVAHFRGLIDSWIADQPWTGNSGTAG